MSGRHPERTLDFVTALLICVVSIGAVGCARSVVAAGGTGECTPAVTYHAGLPICYLPVHLVEAEEQLAVHPVRPVAAVRQLVHIPLRQIVVLSGTGRGQATNAPAVAIVYVFGSPRSACAIAAGCPRSAAYVIAQETVERVVQAGIVLHEASGWFPGPRHVDANIPCRRLSLNLVSNTSGRDLLAVGKRILRAARRSNPCSSTALPVPMPMSQ